MNTLIRLIKEEHGISTIEVVVILGIMLGIALIFRETIVGFVKTLLAEFFDAKKFIQPIK